jgi:hypothetical protein
MISALCGTISGAAPAKNSIERKNGPQLGRLEGREPIQFRPSDSPSFLGDRPEKRVFERQADAEEQ